MWKNIISRLPAKALSDVEIPDASWKPDFDLSDRYQNYANELMRISLLGIAGYGFLIKYCTGDAKHAAYINTEKNCLLAGAIFLGISLGLVLAHRFYSTSCLYYQVIIMRSLKRLQNAHWTAEEKETEHAFLANSRKIQTGLSLKSHYILCFSAIAFGLGFLSVFVVFFYAIRGM